MPLLPYSIVTLLLLTISQIESELHFIYYNHSVKNVSRTITLDNSVDWFYQCFLLIHSYLVHVSENCIILTECYYKQLPFSTRNF